MAVISFKAGRQAAFRRSKCPIMGMFPSDLVAAIGKKIDNGEYPNL